jgi:hypothetical protein
LEQELEDLQDTYREDKKYLQNQIDSYAKYATHFVDLYWDVAIVKTNQLEEQLAKYMKMAGKTYYGPQAPPANKLVHERKCLQVALRFAHLEGEPEGLPDFAREPEFRRKWEDAVDVVMRRIWPEMWAVHYHVCGEGAMSPPTYGILTEYGVLNGDADPQGTVDRIKAIWTELKEIHSVDPEYQLVDMINPDEFVSIPRDGDGDHEGADDDRHDGQDVNKEDVCEDQASEQDTDNERAKSSDADVDYETADSDEEDVDDESSDSSEEDTDNDDLEPFNLNYNNSNKGNPIDIESIGIPSLLRARAAKAEAEAVELKNQLNGLRASNAALLVGLPGCGSYASNGDSL